MNEQDVGVGSALDETLSVGDESRPQSTESVLKKVDRVTLRADVLLRIDAWISQVEQSRPGVEVSRRDLVEWLILRHSGELSPSEIKELADTHYDELRFLKYAIRELKSAKERGEKIALHDMVKNLPALSRPARAVREKKRTVTPGEFTRPESDLVSEPNLVLNDEP